MAELFRLVKNESVFTYNGTSPQIIKKTSYRANMTLTDVYEDWKKYNCFKNKNWSKLKVVEDNWQCTFSKSKISNIPVEQLDNRIIRKWKIYGKKYLNKWNYEYASYILRNCMNHAQNLGCNVKKIQY